SDQSTWIEEKNPYYDVVRSAEGCKKILHEFGLDEDNCHIVNGHVPVKSKDGESPIKGNGKLFVIDGGFSKAYQKTTGIAGYTLIYNSRHMAISAHEPFEGKEVALKKNKDIASSVVVTEELDHRIKIRETDIGKQLQKNVDYLKRLIEAYKLGYIQEQSKRKGS
ncbi:MAG TPA: fructose-bisphosphatase class III, partial [Clostridiales bacterium]|nr:fructose-bisphosphatase class III [Clostridiales bacterium]